MKKKICLLMCSAVLAGALFTGCNADNAPQNGQETAQNPQIQTENQIDKFLSGEIDADGNGLYTDGSFNISELPMDAEEWDSYKIGGRLDLDNDGEDELILDGPYGGMYLDSSGDKIKVFAVGDGTANTLSYTDRDHEIWIVHSDTTHGERKYYNLKKYSGADNMIDRIALEIQEDTDRKKLKYCIDGKEVPETEFMEIYQAFFGK